MLNRATEPTDVNVAAGEGGRRASSQRHLKPDFVEMILLTASCLPKKKHLLEGLSSQAVRLVPRPACQARFCGVP